jgi:hypothetical protein
VQWPAVALISAKNFSASQSVDLFKVSVNDKLG